MAQGSGDKLARGASRANFQTTDGGVSADKWNDIFGDFKPEEFKNAPNKSSVRLRTNGDETGNVSTITPSVGIKVNRK